ncbi:hypothetical protein RJ639_046489 [Escallonia herrerae]|uniref:Vesicle transport protein n=1 Tax=Escallonia herrerae TaxID=1293975 RepID=A0AA89B4D4_9ASTE|nr:hypothetical protein RJ639_046489 [Escallonia herrerae]
MGAEQSKIVLAQNIPRELTSLIVKMVPRRSLLQFIGLSPISLNVYPLLAAQSPEMKEPEVIRTWKIASGVRIQDIFEGEGPQAHEGDLVEVNYVCRRSNGYFVHSTVDQFSGESNPVLLPLDEKQIIKGLKEVLIGMKAGGKRRALIPPSAGTLLRTYSQSLMSLNKNAEVVFSGQRRGRSGPTTTTDNVFVAAYGLEFLCGGLQILGGEHLPCRRVGSRSRRQVRQPHRLRYFQRVSHSVAGVSKGVRDLPGNFQSATSNIPSGKSLVYFGFILAAGVFFIFMAFTFFLPVIVLVPQKFALCFTLGCSFIIGSFFALRGPKNQFTHMASKERLPFTLGFIGSMIGTIYVSMVLHSYILSVFFSVLQVLALAYYAISYFPGGSAGLKFILSSLTSSMLRCFGR